jgi:hypothetical protein
MNLPVALREIRVAAHAPATYRSRMFIGMAGVVGVVWALAAFTELGRGSPHLLGQLVFTVGAWSAFLMAATGFGPTSDAISFEKRAGTLGLLFLTHLKGRDIVLGKLVSNGVNSFAGLVAVFPMLTIPILLGGIEFSQCARLFVSVANMMLFSAAAGLLASTVCVRQQLAQSKAAQIVLFFGAVLPLAAFLLRRFTNYPNVSLGLELLSPLYAQKAAFGALVGPQAALFWLSAGLVFTLSCALLSLASWLAPRCWQEGGQLGLIETITTKIAAAIGGTIKARSPEGRRMLDENPYRWLALRDRATGRSAWMMIGTALSTVAILYFVLNLYWPPSQFWLALWLPFASLVLMGLKVRVGGSAVSHIAQAKENGVLELIMASSLHTREIVGGQFRAVREIFGLHLVAIIALVAAALACSLPSIDRVADMLTTPPQIEPFRTRAFLIFAACVLVLVADCFTFTWVGLCCAFRARNPLKARSWAGFWVIALPAVLYLGGIVILLQFQMLRSYVEGFYPLVILWISIKLIIDVMLVIYCRAWLLHAARQSILSPTEHLRSQSAWPSPATIRQFIFSNVAVCFPRARQS